MHLKTDTSAQSHFSAVPNISRGRNAFGIARTLKTTIKFDYLFPIYWSFIYPGDTISIRQAIMARLTTQVVPLFDDLYFDVHAWFVPFRLVQTNWARYQFNAQPAGPSQDNSALTSPKVDLAALGAGGFTSKSLYDYLGYPTKVDLTGTSQHINNYLPRCYNLIWNENYRDQNLQNPVTVDLDDGPDTASSYVLLKRGKRHDKFSSCLTAAQKGTAVSLPLGTSAPVYGAGNVTATTNRQAWQVWNVTDGGTQAGNFVKNAATRAVEASAWNVGVGTLDAGDSAQSFSLGTAGHYTSLGAQYSPPFADLTNATAATLNEFRSSMAVQHLLEADARGGTRDVESIQHRWGVTVPDFRLQRPEYLGGSTFTFDGHIVPQTSATSGSNYQGNLAQFSQTMGQFGVTHSFTEHGAFMILISTRSNITYQQGLTRELSYQTRYDWYQPEFANIGEVAVLNKEIYLDPSDANNNGTFGFQEYGYELRYQDNQVTGEMRSNYTTSLDAYHMADDYAATPTLGSTWIQSSTDIDRNIAVATATADPIKLNTMVVGKIARTLPMYSIPGLLRL